jgi:hypothetical protein
VSQVALGCLVVKDVPFRSQSSPLVTKFGWLPTKRQYIYPNSSKRTAVPNLVKLPAVIQASRVLRVQCTCLKGRWRGRPTDQCNIQHKTTRAYNATSFAPGGLCTCPPSKMLQVDPSASNCGSAMGRPNGLFASRREVQRLVDVTVHEKGRSVEAMREEGVILEIDFSAFV